MPATTTGVNTMKMFPFPRNPVVGAGAPSQLHPVSFSAVARRITTPLRHYSRTDRLLLTLFAGSCFLFAGFISAVSTTSTQAGSPAFGSLVWSAALLALTAFMIWRAGLRPRVVVWCIMITTRCVAQAIAWGALAASLPEPVLVTALMYVSVWAACVYLLYLFAPIAIALWRVVSVARSGNH